MVHILVCVLCPVFASCSGLSVLHQEQVQGRREGGRGRKWGSEKAPAQHTQVKGHERKKEGRGPCAAEPMPRVL